MIKDKTIQILKNDILSILKRIEAIEDINKTLTLDDQENEAKQLVQKLRKEFYNSYMDHGIKNHRSIFRALDYVLNLL